MRKIISYKEVTLQDFQAVFMAELGFSNRAIESETGLSQSQISYRTQMAGVQRRHYRDGLSKVAKHILSSRNDIVSPDVQVKMGVKYAKKRVQKLAAKKA